MLASAPPTESESNIMRAFDAGWGGVVTKTIGMHPVVNVAGPKTKFLRAQPEGGVMSMNKGRSGTLLSSWNWELISTAPRLVGPPPGTHQEGAPGQGPHRLDHGGLRERQRAGALADPGPGVPGRGGRRAGAEPVLPHMDREDMGSNIGKSQKRTSFGTEVVKEVAKVPVWAKRTPATGDIVLEAGAAFRGGADAITSSNTFPSIPLIDPETLEFEMNVDGLVSSGGLGGPAILPLSLAKMSEMTRAFPEKSFSGIGGIAEFSHALNFFLLGCGTIQVCTAAMLDHAVGPSVIKRLIEGMRDFLEKNAHRELDRLRGTKGKPSRPGRGPNSQIGGTTTRTTRGPRAQEGYAEPVRSGVDRAPAALEEAVAAAREAGALLRATSTPRRPPGRRGPSEADTRPSA